MGQSSRLENWKKWLRKELNFYRIHLIIFIVTPVLFSIVFYLSNGRFKISYIDSLFVCVSAMTVTGLATVDLSELTPWQQTLIFMQMCIGTPIVASWIMVFNRRRYIRKNCSSVFTEFVQKKESEASKGGRWRKLFHVLGIPSPIPSIVVEEHSSDHEKNTTWSRAGTPHNRVRPDMIRRMDDRPMLINPSGFVTGESPTEAEPAQGGSAMHPLSRYRTQESAGHDEDSKRHDDPRAHTNVGFPRSMTVEFADNLPRPRYRGAQTITEQPLSDSGDHSSRHFPTSISLSNHPTHQSSKTYRSSNRTKHQGFGGFPMPHVIIKKFFRAVFPDFERKVTRTLTVPVTTSLVSVPTTQPGEKHANYLQRSQALKLGRNSLFDLRHMEHEQLIEIAYLEYQALGLLLWVIAGYHFTLQLISFAVVAPYMSMPRWRTNFLSPTLHRPLDSVWYSAFQVVSAYTNTGMSLVDTSMVPFQRAYPMIFFVIFLILAGNTCFPIFFRLLIWTIMKVSKADSDIRKVTQFLLDHPRRCYLLLFPSHQTWFLLTVVLFLTFFDWFFFLILDLGNEAISAIPVGIRVLAGFMQGVAVRAAGFGIVPLAALAPAVKVMYVIMMYISVFPIAMSIRSTNVYEEKSLGIYHDPEEEEEEGELYFKREGNRMTVWSRYLTMHAKQQLAFDMWWLAISLFLVCIAESKHINNPENASWFSIFNILFEIVSAYGTVGLSLGLPTNNYSFSGAFRPISKLIICAVMIRGRHRGLPVAIDRAVMFPSEYQQVQQSEDHGSGDDNRSHISGSMRSPSIQIQEPYPDGILEKGFRREGRERTIKRTVTISSQRSGASLRDHAAFTRSPPLEPIPQANSKPSSVKSWESVERFERSGGRDEGADSEGGEGSSDPSFHRSDTSSSHRGEGP